MAPQQSGDSSGFDVLSSQDKERVTLLAAQYGVVKQAAEFYGRRPQRYSLLLDDPSQPLPAGAKRINFIRHGEGLHNVFRAAEHTAGRQPRAKRDNMQNVPEGLYDPSLTEAGRQEAMAARPDAKACQPQLLVTSPVRRAVQTLLLAFEDSVAAGTPIMAHELCREQFQGSDPSIYDARQGRSALASEFPMVDFESYVLPEEPSPEAGAVLEAKGGIPSALVGVDPIWWHVDSPLGCCDGELNIAACAEHAWGFLTWLMGRQEQEIAVATHSLFLLALYHGSLESVGGGPFPRPQIFRTGELRTVVIAEAPAPQKRAATATLERWGAALTGSGFKAGAGSEETGREDEVEVKGKKQRSRQ
ncbi:unnamed protein product [Polarella glacialis]|uniref:Phosphoglycerate mutase family protein n=1 Tax=Polarella glacialis TaxID=89957 RepID=A0A813LNH8_POLGL|nr:unnamed protein product [Polarella glacialis]CAE8735515.1 unnamed protein product [Polarella glacialis]